MPDKVTQQWIDKQQFGEGAYALTIFACGCFLIGVFFYIFYGVFGRLALADISVSTDIPVIFSALILLMLGLGYIIETLDMRSIARVIVWDGSEFNVNYFFLGGVSFSRDEIKSITTFQLSRKKISLCSLSRDVSHYLITLNNGVSFRILGDIENILEFIEKMDGDKSPPVI